MQCCYVSEKIFLFSVFNLSISNHGDSPLHFVMILDEMIANKEN